MKSFLNAKEGDKIRSKVTGQSFTVEHLEYYDTMPNEPRILVLSRTITASNPDEWEHTGYTLEKKLNLIEEV